MKRTEFMIEYDKLVRDRIPDVFAAQGKWCETRQLSMDEWDARLSDELVEECAEFRTSGEIEELADVVEVICALVKARGMTWDAFETIRLAKRAARGGFDARILLIRGER